MIILNIGCGSKTSAQTFNIDKSILLKIKKNRLLTFAARFYFSEDRMKRLRDLPDNIISHDLSRGIPFDSNSVDAVYHSHFFEHLPQNAAPLFLNEVYRVLKVGGIHRIVVPDLEKLCRDYLHHLAACEQDAEAIPAHDDFIASIFSQVVRAEADGTSKQGVLRRGFENLVLGDARERGESHMWMYDKFNLRTLLQNAGFQKITVQKYNTSFIAGWNDIGLDLENGQAYKPGSLYIEALK